MTSIFELRTTAARAMREGRIEEGILAYQALLAVEPGSASSWYNLGYLLRCAGRFDQALDAYAQALERKIDRPEEVHLNRAVILSEFREDEAAAVIELQRATDLAPRFLPAWLNLGNLHEDRGASANARDAYQQVLTIDPGHGRAHARLAAIDLHEGQASAAMLRLRRVLATPGLSAVDAAEVGFALGGALDAQGLYDEAFAAFAAANRAARNAVQPQFHYDRGAHQYLIDRLIALPPAHPNEEPCGQTEATPLFICGMFRSGSTLVERILSRHSRITSGGEMDMLPALAASLKGYPDVLDHLPPDALAAIRRHYMEEARVRHPAAALLTDKRPDNFLHIGLIKRLFPDARIVHTVRNPLDTMLSVYFLYFDDSISYGHDLGDIAHWFGQYQRLMSHWRDLYPSSIHDLSYDALVNDPAPTIAPLLPFCGLEWEDAVLRPEAAGGLVRTASVWQVRQRLHRRSSGRWRNYVDHIGPLKRLLDEMDIGT